MSENRVSRIYEGHAAANDAVEEPVGQSHVV
jgi:hypothetical protein